jgi:hypothetical protein
MVQDIDFERIIFLEIQKNCKYHVWKEILV